MIDRISSANVQSMLEVLRTYQSQAAGNAGAAAEPAATKVGQPTFFDSVASMTRRKNHRLCLMPMTAVKKYLSPKWC